MTPPHRSAELLLPESRDAAALAAQLAAAPRVTAEDAMTLERTLLDTFDWRLYRGGTRAEAILGGEGPAFLWRRADGQPLRRLAGPAPRFAWDLPPGPARRELAAAIEMRALLPRVRVCSRVWRFGVRDKRAKLVARLVLEDNTLRDAPQLPLRPRLRLEPLRGYAEQARKARRRLLDPLGLPPAAGDLLEEAATQLGLTPGGYSTKVRVALEPDLPAGTAARRILLRLLDTLEANEAGTAADLDSEFLHDFRVAVRRTRAALGQLKGVLPAAAVARYREEFAWLGAITSPVRDLDVYRLNFPAYQAALAPGRRGDLEPLAAFLAARQRAAQRALARRLDGARYRKLKAGWRAFLETGPDPDDPPAAATPVIAVARARIWKVYRRVLRDGAALHGESPAEPFHELRKTCKKLRYLLEFFHGLFPPKQVAKLVGALKLIQDNLGTHNDLEVQAAALAGFGRQMQEQGSAPAECLMAMGSLVEDLELRQLQVRREFAALFARFSAPPTRKTFRTLFAPGAGDRGARR